MGKYKHHSGSVSGGVNLSKEKTPHDKDIKDMPLFKMGKPYAMGVSKRGPLDKHSMSQDHKMAYDRSEIFRLKKDIHYDDLKKKGMSMEGPLEGNAFGYAMQKTGGDYDKAKAMLQKKGPLNKKDKKHADKQVLENWRNEKEEKYKQSGKKSKQVHDISRNDASTIGKGPKMMGNNMHPKPVKKRTMTKTIKKLPRKKA